MTRFLWQLGLEMRLQLRNRLGLLYLLLFPSVFVLAFRVLYQHEPVPLVRHVGELLTVTALAGACLGLPVALVSERERGVWRRYRLAPVSLLELLATSLLARYFLLVLAAVLQIFLAMGLGMPAPEHTLQLWAAFSVVALSLLGLGLLLAALAGSVTAAQGLGQSVFLPMLILGGVAVRPEAMPELVQRLAAFFPGRYAVLLIQQSVSGEATVSTVHLLTALLLMGSAAFVAGGRLFRTDSRRRLPLRSERGWLVAALSLWMMVGMSDGLATRQPEEMAGEPVGRVPPQVVASAPGPEGTAVTSEIPEGFVEPQSELPQEAADDGNSSPVASSPSPSDPDEPASLAIEEADAEAIPEAIKPVEVGAGEVAEEPDPAPPQPWQSVTPEQIERDLYFDHLPPDAGVVAPIARQQDRYDTFVVEQLDCIETMLDDWPPAQHDDPVQRVRNVLYVAAAPDVWQMPEIESVVPLVVFDWLQREIPPDTLLQLLYWVATRPFDGDDSAADQLFGACLEIEAPEDRELLRYRAGMYAVKLVGRMTGQWPVR